MPYHVLVRVKYENLGRNYSLEDTQVPDQDYMDGVRQIFLDKGLDVRII